METAPQELILNRFKAVHHRQLVVISGAEVWCLNIIEQIINKIPEEHRKVLNLLTCNADLPTGAHFPSTNNTQFRQHLGREYDWVIYNAWRGLRAGALAALSGTIKSNGLMFLLCPDLNKWHQYDDPELKKRISWGSVKQKPNSLFIQHLIRDIHSNSSVMLLTETGLTGNNLKVADSDPHADAALTEQRQLIENIKKVATGHRKRPLVITADRGRGKTASLGIALAELMSEGFSNMLVTAPQKSSVDTLFRHATAIEPTAVDAIKFIAIDELSIRLPNAELVVVDEAAAIPVAILQKLTLHYSRIVFTTTINGYEGSGRGFDVRFKPWLLENRPQARIACPEQPFRWYQNDCLELFWWQTLQLKRQISPPEGQTNKEQALLFKAIDKSELLDDPALLNAVFSLLVDAHYQTTPDDLVSLLDAPEQKVFLLFSGETGPETLVAVLSGNMEGNIADEQLRQNIVAGQRRVQGHMLPQQLAYSCAKGELLSLRYFRVIRIAVQANLRQQGLGKFLLNQTQAWCREAGIQLIGSSFGVTSSLLDFWLSEQFQPILLGFHRDKATAEFNLTVLKPVDTSNDFSHQIEVMQNDLLALLRFHLPDLFKALDAGVLYTLLHQILKHTSNLSGQTLDTSKLKLFYKSNRSLELSAPLLEQALLEHIGMQQKFSDELELLLDYCLKKLPTEHLVKKHQLTGKKALLFKLQQLTESLVVNNGS